MCQFLAALDAIMCVAVVFASLDCMRVVYFFDRPVASIACLIMAIGAFCLILWLMMGNTPSIGAFMLQLGMAAFAIEHRNQVVDRESGMCWPNIDRRGRE